MNFSKYFLYYACMGFLFVGDCLSAAATQLEKDVSKASADIKDAQVKQEKQGKDIEDIQKSLEELKKNASPTPAKDFTQDIEAIRVDLDALKKAGTGITQQALDDTKKELLDKINTSAISAGATDELKATVTQVQSTLGQLQNDVDQTKNKVEQAKNEAELFRGQLQNEAKQSSAALAEKLSGVKTAIRQNNATIAKTMNDLSKKSSDQDRALQDALEKQRLEISKSEAMIEKLSIEVAKLKEANYKLEKDDLKKMVDVNAINSDLSKNGKITLPAGTEPLLVEVIEETAKKLQETKATKEVEKEFAHPELYAEKPQTVVYRGANKVFEKKKIFDFLVSQSTAHAPVDNITKNIEAYAEKRLNDFDRDLILTVNKLIEENKATPKNIRKYVRIICGGDIQSKEVLQPKKTRNSAAGQAKSGQSPKLKQLSQPVTTRTQGQAPQIIPPPLPQRAAADAQLATAQAQKQGQPASGTNVQSLVKGQTPQQAQLLQKPQLAQKSIQPANAPIGNSTTSTQQAQRLVINPEDLEKIITKKVDERLQQVKNTYDNNESSENASGHAKRNLGSEEEAKQAGKTEHKKPLKGSEGSENERPINPKFDRLDELPMDLSLLLKDDTHKGS